MNINPVLFHVLQYFCVCVCVHVYIYIYIYILIRIIFGIRGHRKGGTFLRILCVDVECIRLPQDAASWRTVTCRLDRRRPSGCWQLDRNSLHAVNRSRNFIELGALDSFISPDTC
jgi:hypothetical protein